MIGVADLTDQSVVGMVFLDPLHLQDLVRPGGQTGQLGKFSQELLGFQDPGGVGDGIPAMVHQTAGVHDKEPVLLRQEKTVVSPTERRPSPTASTVTPRQRTRGSSFTGQPM